MNDQYEIKPGTFSLFRVEEKESDKHPDMTGKGKTPDGELVYVAAWFRESKSGKKYLYGTIQKPREQSPSNDKPASKPTSFADMKDDLPF